MIIVSCWSRSFDLIHDALRHLMAGIVIDNVPSLFTS